jgi:GR25 family glycosyltransferase involved in LPS biosynthesis
MNARAPQAPAPRKDVSVCVALVHNHDEVRNSIIQPNIEELCEFLGDTCEVRSFEVAYQPEIKPLAPELALERKRRARQLGREWAAYKELDAPAQDQPLSTTAAEQRAGAVELALTDKHIRAWCRFLESPCDFLLCFEDDAIFRHSSESRLLEVLQRAKAQGAGANLYVDLAGGFHLASLGIERLLDRREGDFIYFKKPVTNTTCTYLLNRAMAKDFVEMVVYDPTLRYAPADWLINGLLIGVEKLGRKSVCFHAEPTVFEHGSAQGVWQSTLR